VSTSFYNSKWTSEKVISSLQKQFPHFLLSLACKTYFRLLKIGAEFLFQKTEAILKGLYSTVKA